MCSQRWGADDEGMIGNDDLWLPIGRATPDGIRARFGRPEKRWNTGRHLPELGAAASELARQPLEDAAVQSG